MCPNKLFLKYTKQERLVRNILDPIVSLEETLMYFFYKKLLKKIGDLIKRFLERIIKVF
jgi:hypothetical protein